MNSLHKFDSSFSLENGIRPTAIPIRARAITQVKALLRELVI
tara:strand:+ start:190 stop:315 length:126 start_codon:yes stop_codon:yes gene_type:complete